ncbi:peptidylprolyl isomerase [Pelagicoccus sp. SDUM812005]|uniref:FKBP-type peptidyl-prolyl cis-trans isomerase n=1 Tax=Pelagicoccus sp. SDUM812005 TaxID=3041257 RepID=UPI00280D19D8|nr:peptidylprolyl isomerase [Pelagicoccus sp. SDUM812005]MDQ8179502.1 peptidylprolyl isomerase [Pelagicoccus sp. SDUM812005]
MSTQQVISFNYTLRNKAGEVLDQSPEGRPLEFLSGVGQIIEGLEENLLGMEEGASGDVVVRPEKGYGFRDESQIDTINISQLPVDEVKVGDYFQAGPDRHAPIVRVVKVEGDQVTLDANHPLAGEDLIFSVDLVAKRDATEEELAHGHAHSAGGCCGGGGGGGCGCSGEEPAQEAVAEEGGCCGGGQDAAKEQGHSHGGCGCSH